MALDVTDVTKFTRTTAELEEFLLLCLVVAGKTAHVQEEKLRNFLVGARGLSAFCIGFRNLTIKNPKTPFGWLRLIAKYSTVGEHDIEVMLRNVKLGQYHRLFKAIMALLQRRLNLRTCTLEDLTAIPGIGPKTARMFILHSRADADHAVLDVHILRYMRETLGLAQAPRNTPPEGPLYSELERLFIEHARSIHKSPATLDLEIWNRYSKKAPEVL